MPFFIALFKDCIRIFKRFSSNDTTVYAAQASFFIIISVFPFLMLLLTLVQSIPGISPDSLMKYLSMLLPEMLHDLMHEIVESIYVDSRGTVISITAISTLWSASIGIMSIERGLNRIYGYTDRRNYVLRRIICAFYTLIFAFSCIAALVLLVLGSSLMKIACGYIPFLASIASSIVDIGRICAFVLLLFVFVGLYTVLPWKKQNPWQQVPGALLSVIGWMIFSYLFSIYFSNFSNFSRTYGSLTAIVLLMLWLYFCICIVFLGAEINHHLYDREADSDSRKKPSTFEK